MGFDAPKVRLPIWQKDFDDDDYAGGSPIHEYGAANYSGVPPEAT